MEYYQYIRVPTWCVPPESGTIQTITSIADDGYVYLDIRRGAAATSRLEY
jgi:hypothetical protein